VSGAKAGRSATPRAGANAPAGILALVALLAACGTASSGLSLSAADNDPAKLAQALARVRSARSAATRALAVVVVREDKTELRAIDLAANRRLWSVAADVRSRVAIGTTLVASREGDDLVARALTDGHAVWKAPLGPATRLIGLSVDGDKVVYAAEAGQGPFLAALDGNQVRWRLPAPGAIGAPEADGGLVYLPLQSQWLAVIDETDGQVLARVRRNDLAVSGVRALPEGPTYGSRAVLRLADGPTATPLPAELPEGVESRWFLDSYNPVHASYSAFDRARLLWRPAAQGGFAGPVVALAFRALFAYDPATGTLRWARAIPRADIVSAEHAGTTIVYATADGQIDLLEPESGMLLAEASAGGRVVGASFAADGFRPPAPAGPSHAPSTDDALAAIARDKDSRFAAQKRLAVRELGRRGNLAATTILVALLGDPATPAELAEDAGAALLARPDPTVTAPIVAALAVHTDRVSGKRPRGVALLARALAAGHAREAVGPLLDHLEDPATPPPVVDEIAAALVQIADPSALPRLSSILLLHRCDPDAAPIASAMVDALAALGGGPERELLAFVADDPRTTPALAAHAREKLGH